MGSKRKVDMATLLEKLDQMAASINLTLMQVNSPPSTESISFSTLCEGDPVLYGQNSDEKVT